MHDSKVKYSIVLKISGIFTLITALAMFSMGFSILVAHSTDGDAAAINLSGSLRMQSYRMASAVQLPHTQEQQLIDLANVFSARFTSNTLVSAVPGNPKHSTYQVYEQVKEEWKVMKPLVLGDPIHKQLYLERVDSFVDSIDRMVREFQINSEQKIAYLRTVQLITISLSVLATLLAVWVIRANVVRPLGILTSIANILQDGDFSARSRYSTADEFGLLSQTFDQMADNLSGLYADLEAKVEEKTHALSQSNNSLKTLYETSKTFSEHPDEIVEHTPEILKQLQNITNCEAIAFCQSGDNNLDISLVLSDSETLKQTLAEAQSLETELRQDFYRDKGLVVVDISHQGQSYGMLIAQNSQILNDFQLQLMGTVADIFANAIRLATYAEDEARIALASERAVIARELHDSLAQALSYQNIQTTRLRRSLNSNQTKEQTFEIIEELQNGITGSYKQLRELITTFRIKSDSPGLRPALETTIDEFNHYSTTKFHLRYRIGIKLAPNEEIHCLHIVREALSNVIKHANASVCDIDAIFDGEQVTLRIRDNGVGLPENSEKHGHYGLTILEERAIRMGGTLLFHSPESHGTEVQVQFVPKILRNTEDKGTQDE